MPKKPEQSVQLQQERIKEYILKEQTKGFSIGPIKTKLVQAGYNSEEIESTISKYNLAKTENAKLSVTSSQTSTKSPHNPRIWGLVAAIVAAAILIGFFVVSGPIDCGDDEECFITYANECKKATLSQSTKGAVFQYGSTISSEVRSDCSLVKRVDSLDESEPQEIRDIFEGTSMTCTYEQGNFNPELVTTITRGLENCEGTLKTAIYELVLAVYELQQEGKI